MMTSPQRAKSILALVCLVLVFCLVQRSFNNLPTQPVTPVSVSAHASQPDDIASSDKPCALGAKSLSGSAPLLDTALPFLVLLALIATLFQSTPATGYRRAPPLRRRHLTFCVFQE